MSRPAKPSEPTESVLETARMRLVQLAPCCLDHLFGIDGAYDRDRLADHIVDRHDWKELR